LCEWQVRDTPQPNPAGDDPSCNKAGVFHSPCAISADSTGTELYWKLSSWSSMISACQPATQVLCKRSSGSRREHSARRHMEGGGWGARATASTGGGGVERGGVTCKQPEVLQQTQQHPSQEHGARKVGVGARKGDVAWASSHHHHQTADLIPAHHKPHPTSPPLPRSNAASETHLFRDIDCRCR
jgi:hypothetical protein